MLSLLAALAACAHAGSLKTAGPARVSVDVGLSSDARLAAEVAGMLREAGVGPDGKPLAAAAAAPLEPEASGLELAAPAPAFAAVLPAAEARALGAASGAGPPTAELSALFDGERHRQEGLSEEELNLTAAHYAQEEPRLRREFSLRPARPPQELRAGDVVKLGMRPFYAQGSNGFVYKDFVEGTVKSVVVDGGHPVGVVLQRAPERSVSEKSGYKSFGEEVVWYNDLEPEDATVVSRDETAPASTVEASAIPEPAETTFPILFPYGEDSLVPVAPGDEVTLHFKETNGATILLSGRGTNGRRIESIARDASGRAIGLVFRRLEGDGIYPYARVREDGTFTVYFREILRASGIFRYSTPKASYSWFKAPASRLRFRGRAVGYAWLPALGSSARTPEDSGDYTLRVARGTMLGPVASEAGDVEAPVSVGDELLLSLKKPGSVLGFAYDRFVVRAIIKDSQGRTQGFRSERLGSGDPTTVVRLSDFNRDDSYIDANAWSALANKTPGGWTKRRGFRAHVADGYREGADPDATADFFAGLYERMGRRDEADFIRGLFGAGPRRGARGRRAARSSGGGPAESLAPWTTAPMDFDAWRERTGSADKRRWALWVLQAGPGDDDARLKSRLRKLYMKFHPDRRAQSGLPAELDVTAVAQLLGEAKSVLLP